MVTGCFPLLPSVGEPAQHPSTGDSLESSCGSGGSGSSACDEDEMQWVLQSTERALDMEFSRYQLLSPKDTDME